MLACLWRFQQKSIKDFNLSASLPPAFIVAAEDDKVSPATEAVEMAKAFGSFVGSDAC